MLVMVLRVMLLLLMMMVLRVMLLLTTTAVITTHATTPPSTPHDAPHRCTQTGIRSRSRSAYSEVNGKL